MSLATEKLAAGLAKMACNPGVQEVVKDAAVGGLTVAGEVLLPAVTAIAPVLFPVAAVYGVYKFLGGDD